MDGNYLLDSVKNLKINDRYYYLQFTCRHGNFPAGNKTLSSVKHEASSTAIRRGNTKRWREMFKSGIQRVQKRESTGKICCGCGMEIAVSHRIFLSKQAGMAGWYHWDCYVHLIRSRNYLNSYKANKEIPDDTESA